MPTYEYACSACGDRLEVYQSFSEDPLKECRSCGGPLRRVFHPVGILFKGSGFYSTDARGKSSKANGADGSSNSSKEESQGSSEPKKASGDSGGGSSPSKSGDSKDT